MTTEVLRAVARKLVRLHRRFAKLFGRKEAKKHSLVYLRGLLVGEGRKNIERMALRFATGRNGQQVGQKEVVAMQSFISQSPWESTKVQQEIQAAFAEEFVPSASNWPIGTVGVLDESSFVKSGNESVGTKRQWCGRLGKIENCQVGVFLIGVTPDGCVSLEQQLYLPEEWAKDKKRRKKTHVPHDVKFETKPQIAERLLRRTAEAGRVRFDWVVADDEYGRNERLLDSLDGMKQRYVCDVPADTTFWTTDPATSRRSESVRQARRIAAQLATSEWQTLSLREGTKGPVAYRFARRRVWAMRSAKAGPPVWLVFRRSLDSRETTYHVSNGDENVSLEEMALAGGCRWRVEEYFKDGKGHFGMADYETRSWNGWHHHMSLVALSHLFVMQTRKELKNDTPDLTLSMVVELLKSALKRPELTTDDACHLIAYHLQRNQTATQSHRKSWLRKHKNAKPKALL